MGWTASFLKTGGLGGMLKELEAEEELLQHLQGHGSALHRRICLTIFNNILSEEFKFSKRMHTNNLNYANLNYALIIQAII